MTESDKAEMAIEEGETETLWETVKPILYAVIIAMVFRTFIYQPFTIPSESMLKNLMVGDYLLVSKFSYGYSHHSLPFSPKIFSGRIFGKMVERGDVAVFRLPSDPDIYYIKRIIGLPGDTIQMKKGGLHINGERVQTKQIDDYVRFQKVQIGMTEQVIEERFEQFEETLPGGKTFVTLNKGYSPSDDTGIFRVPEGHYFAMGDNRDNSKDSRVPRRNDGVGYVPAENIVGRAEWITLSFDDGAKLWEFWKWFPSERRERFFTSIR